MIERAPGLPAEQCRREAKKLFYERLALAEAACLAAATARRDRENDSMWFWKWEVEAAHRRRYYWMKEHEPHLYMRHFDWDVDQELVDARFRLMWAEEAISDQGRIMLGDCLSEVYELARWYERTLDDWIAVAVPAFTTTDEEG